MNPVCLEDLILNRVKFIFYNFCDYIIAFHQQFSVYLSISVLTSLFYFANKL